MRSKRNPLSATIITIFTILAIGVMVMETMGQKLCFEVLPNTYGVSLSSSTCVIQWCATQCKRKEANGIGTCKPRPNQEKVQYRKLKEECHCVYKCS
ncbi:S locus-related glycoprotein 1 binding pollen coat protein [Arabidopsis suecica]|uniref:S locus-related glycoprotein 1 binding pollen coat protein n=1 Tax=Arabidopsis suecica TaxID=45249 RepID=A0A8T2CL86_ARASU|nr:S locus-related glycoprotein 1 binding pollen coat protein [Arabidopsis suecica]